MTETAAGASGCQLDAGGLEVVESQEYAWIILGDHFGEVGIARSPIDPNTPVLLVAMRGTGSWAGPGFVPPDFKLDGVTVAINGITGATISATGDYAPPTGIMLTEYRQVLDHPTLAPIVPALWSKQLTQLH